jgi:hypothetical protein
MLYLGAAGMAWALRRLGSALDVELAEVDAGPASSPATRACCSSRADDAQLQRLIEVNR